MTSLKIIINKINRGNAGFLIGAMVLLASLIFVHRQFAGYDLSLLIDLSWRLANKQIPGVDFINTLPPLVVVFIKFISWGNLRWVDLTIINIIATGGTFLFLYLMFDHREESIWWGLFIAIILAIPLVSTNHIWYSSLAQLSGIIIFYSVYVAINSNHLKTKILLSIFLASGLLSISKQNVALPMMLSVIVSLLFLKRQDKFILISTILLGAVIGIVLSMFYLGYSFDSFIYTYSAVLGRTKINQGMLNTLISVKSHYPLAILMLGFCCFFIYSIYEKDSKISNVNKIYFLLILAISLIPIITDWDMKLNNVSLPLFIFTTGIFSSIKMVDTSTSQEDYQHPVPRILITFIFLLTIYALSLISGYVREGMKNRPPPFFFDSNANVVIDKGYFSGLRTGNLLSMVLNEIATAKNEFSDQKIFFGQSLEFGYLCTKSQSPHGMPLWWHPGTSYGIFDEKKIVENFIQAKFDVLIFIKSRCNVPSPFAPKPFALPKEIQNFIAENYWLDDKYQYIDLYRKTKSDSALSYYGRGNTYARRGQYKLAIEYYNKAIRINPNYANAYYIRGIIYLESGQYQKAVQDLSETIRIKPDYISSYYNRGIAYSKTGKYQLAIKDYSETIRLKPDHADAYNNRGAVYLNLGNNELGCLDARKACELGNCKILKVADSTGVCH